LVRVVSHLAAWPGSGRAGRSSVLHAVLLIQFLPLAYGLRNQMPDPRATQARAALVERLRGLPGPVLVPGFGDAAIQAGKGDAFQPLALDLLLSSRGNALMAHSPTLAETLFASLRSGSGRPTVVLGDEPEPRGPVGPLREVLAHSYRRVAEWRELADSPAPRFVYAARMETAEAPPQVTTTLAGAVTPADSSTTR